MNTKIKFLGLALLGMLIFSTSCKKEEEKIEESFGIVFTVATSDGDSWDTTTATAEMIGSEFVIKTSKDNKEVVLTIKDFAEGSYFFNDTLNYGTYTSDKSDVTKLYNSTIAADNYIEIINIHSDGVKFDGKFSFLAIDANNAVQTISGTWINVSKQ